MKLLFCGSGWQPIVERIRTGLPPGVEIDIWDRRKTLASVVSDVDVLLPSNGRISREVIQAATKLQLIQQPAAGVDGIDLEAATAKGIPVCNAPGTNHQAVAEAALLLMLSVARRLNEARVGFSHGEIGTPLGGELAGKQLGLVGYGKSGQSLAKIAEAIGMKVSWTRSSSTFSEFADLLRNSDLISIHCPLTEKTRGMFDKEAFSLMKKGAILVNCARGPIVCRRSLEVALANGDLGGVGLDVFWDEPWNPDDHLFHRNDVEVLPHIGGSTAEAFSRIAKVVCDNVSRVLVGKNPLYCVNSPEKIC